MFRVRRIGHRQTRTRASRIETTSLRGLICQMRPTKETRNPNGRVSPRPRHDPQSPLGQINLTDRIGHQRRPLLRRSLGERTLRSTIADRTPPSRRATSRRLLPSSRAANLRLLPSSRAANLRRKRSPGQSLRVRRLNSDRSARNNLNNARFVSNSTNNTNSRRTTNGTRTNRKRTISGSPQPCRRRMRMATQTRVAIVLPA
jgi:hypothetical protein